jgi:hypothetical protein
LLYAYHLANFSGIEELYKQQQVLQLVRARQFGMNLAYIVFGCYLILGGILIYKAPYIPTVMGILIMLAGLSWIMISFTTLLFQEL